MPNPSGAHSQEDQQLIQQYKQSGDMEVLGVLYKKYMHLVYGVCLKYLKNREESQDTVMQIFEKLISSLQKHDIDNFKSWLYVFSKNYCLMQLRASKYKASENSAPLVVENTLLLHPTDENDLENDLQKLEKCIDELQNQQKKCVQLFYLEKKSYKEIESLTAIALKKVKSHIQNGKRNLKLCMESNHE